MQIKNRNIRQLSRKFSNCKKQYKYIMNKLKSNINKKTSQQIEID